MSEVRNYSFSGSCIFVVGEIKLGCRFFNNFSDCCVMYMANVGKDVVFHLMVESARKPIDDPVFGTKVYRSEQLVDGPGILHTPVFRRQGRFRIVYYVCQLENNTE